MTSLSRSTTLFLMLAILGLALFPLTGDEFYMELAIHLMVMGMFAMSLDLLIGYTGLVSFGHAAFFGLSGYLLGIITPEAGPISIWVALPFCLFGTAIAALAIGWFSVRTAGIYFIMITLAFSQMLFYYFNENLALGGSDGMFIFTKPQVYIGSIEILDLSNPNSIYYFTLGCLIVCYFILRMILRAPFGHVLVSIRINEHRTKALGFNTHHYKLVAFVIAGTIAGLAGFIEATSTGIISPGHLNWHQSGLVMMIVILGGMGTLYGPVIGAFALGILHDQAQDYTEHWLLIQGVFIVLIVLFLPRGIAGMLPSKKHIATEKTTPEDDKGERS